MRIAGSVALVMAIRIAVTAPSRKPQW
jgi:hypothetical protein